MVMTDAEVLVSVERAYERGRLAYALRAAWLALPMIALSLSMAHRPWLSLGAGAALLALAVALRFRGRASGRAVMPALIAGLAPLLMPVLMRMIGFASAIEREGRGPFLIAATLIAGLSGVLGCAIVGVAGMAGMVLAVIAASWPVAMLSRARI
jgi:hypothetical protein